MRDIIIRKSLIYGIILTLVVTSLSPSILGITEENRETNPITSNINTISLNDEQLCDYSNIREKYNFNPKEKVCKFFNLELNSGIYDEEVNQRYGDLGTGNSLFSSGSWDYILKGYVTDVTNNNPIEDAEVLIISYGEHMIFERYSTNSDFNGYYEINLEDIYYWGPHLIVRADGYYSHLDPYLFWFSLIWFTEIVWMNISLTPGSPSENSKICGYVLDADNADPVEGAIVDLLWTDYKGHDDWQYTYSDSTGYYSVDVASGAVLPYVNSEGYKLGGKIQEQVIEEGETLWVNIYLYPRFPDTATVCGYITDELTGDPIEDVLIDIFSWLEYENFILGDTNYSFTDSSGFYKIMVPLSNIKINVISFEHARCYSYSDEIVEGEILWWNTTLYHIHPQTAVICGNITDEFTHDPIDKAYVDLSWEDQNEHRYDKWTYSDASGFYKLTIAPGEITLWADARRYFDSQEEIFQIGENETIWIDFALESYPPEKSVVRGYIVDDKTGNPIKYADVFMLCKDNQGRNLGNGTYTDTLGFYEMNVAAGEIYLRVTSDGYHYTYTETYTIDDYETLTIDVALEPIEKDINLVKPKQGVYIGNNYLFPFIVPIVIGGIDIEVNDPDLREVEFYIDGDFKRAVRFDSYTYTWDEKTFGRHKITLICTFICDGRIKVVTKNINVWKFF